MSAETVPYVCDEAEARELTEAIRRRAEQTWALIEQAYKHRAWSALGYETWDAYCATEFGTTRLRLPREERSEVVASLRDSGMSLRAIGAATGDSVRTIRRDLSGVANATRDPDPLAEKIAAELAASDGDYAAQAAAASVPDNDVVDAEVIDHEPAPVTGLDGKKYPSSAPPRAPRAPRTDVVSVMTRALARAQDAAHSASFITKAHLTNRSEEAAVWSRDLSTSLQALQRLLDALQEASK